MVDFYLFWHFTSSAVLYLVARIPSHCAHIWWAIALKKSTRSGRLSFVLMFRKQHRLLFGCARSKSLCPYLMGDYILEVSPQWLIPSGFNISQASPISIWLLEMHVMKPTFDGRSRPAMVDYFLFSFVHASYYDHIWLIITILFACAWSK